jgi:hypothetical protein
LANKEPTKFKLCSKEAIISFRTSTRNENDTQLRRIDVVFNKGTLPVGQINSDVILGMNVISQLPKVYHPHVLALPRLEDDTRESTISNKELPQMVKVIFQHALTTTDMTLQAQQTLESTLQRFHDVFRREVRNDPPAKVSPAFSELIPGSLPYHGAVRRCKNDEQRHWLQNFTQELEHNGFIVKITTPNGLPLVLL